MPKRILEKPNLFLGSSLFLNAWFDLDTERERPHRITRSMCFNYADDYEFDSEQKEDLWHHIKAMDAEFLVWWQKKQPKTKPPRVPDGRK